MLDQKNQITQLTANVSRLQKNATKQQKFTRDLAQLLAVFTARFKTMTSILTYTIEETSASDGVNKKHDDIILNINAQIGTIYRNYKLNTHFAGRPSKIFPWKKFESSQNLQKLCVNGMTPDDIFFKFSTPQYLATSWLPLAINNDSPLPIKMVIEGLEMFTKW